MHPHESPKVMTYPLIALATLSALGGLLTLNGWISDWLTPVVGEHEEHHLAIPAIVMSLIILVVVAAGVAVSVQLVGKRPVPKEAPTDVSIFTKAARADLYGDAFNDAVIIQPGVAGIGALATFDRTVVDGAAEGTATAFAAMSAQFRLLQNGFVRSYALALLAGAALVLLALLAVNFG